MSTTTLRLPARHHVAPVARRPGTDLRLHLPGVAVLGLASAALLVPWIVYLARALPARYVLTGWSAAWVGFDVLLAVALATTGLLARRRHALWPSAAFASAALLVADAWFDVMTSGTGGLLVPVLSAALVELPLAALLLHHAVRATRAVAATGGRTVTEHADARGEGAAAGG